MSDSSANEMAAVDGFSAARFFDRKTRHFITHLWPNINFNKLLNGFRLPTGQICSKSSQIGAVFPRQGKSAALGTDLPRHSRKNERTKLPIWKRQTRNLSCNDDRLKPSFSFRVYTYVHKHTTSSLPIQEDRRTNNC